MHKTLLVLTLSVSSFACISMSKDMRGEYDATMTRSSTAACKVATPAPKSISTIVQIDDAERIHIQGGLPCQATWSATDYGPVGTVNGVADGCALQPIDMKFEGGDFRVNGFSMTWKAADNDACVVTDEWSLTKR